MMSSRSIAVLVSISWVAIALAAAEAWACSASMPVRHTIRWTKAGLIALADPKGRVLRQRPDGQFEEVKLSKAFAHTDAAFDLDGTKLLTLELDWSNEELGAACEATAVEVALSDLATGTRRLLKRLNGSGSLTGSLSPSGDGVLAWAYDRSGTLRMHVFDGVKGARLRVADAPSALWLDEARIVVTSADDDPLRVVDAASGRWLTKVPSAPRGMERTLLSGDEGSTGFSAVDRRNKMYRLLRVRLEGEKAVVDRASWTTQHEPLSVAGDGSRVLARDVTAVARMLVFDRASGAEVGRIEGQYAYTASALSPDGAQVAVVSHETPTRDELEDMYDHSAFKATTIEVFDLATGKLVSHWGAPTRSKLSSPPAAAPSEGGR